MTVLSTVPCTQQVISEDPLHYQLAVVGPAVTAADPRQWFYLGPGRGTERRARRAQYLSGAIRELVGQNVAIDLGRGGHPGQSPRRLCHGRWTKVSGRVNVCVAKVR